MANLILNGSTSGSVTLSSPAVSGTTTLTLPASSGTVTVAGVNSNIVAGTAQATTSGTSKDFTGIPSWVKRITVMLNGVSTSGTGAIAFRLGSSGGFETTGYVSGTTRTAVSTLVASSATTSFFVNSDSASYTLNGNIVFTLLNPDTNTWTATGMFGHSTTIFNFFVAGSISLAGTLTQVRVLTANGTDTFDAGSINILYE